MAVGVRKGNQQLMMSAGSRYACSAAVPKTGAPDIAKLAPRRPIELRFAPASIQQIQIFIVAGAGVGVHPLLELHLVTAAQRGYSFGLLEVYGAKFQGRRFHEHAARPANALRDAEPNAVPQGSDSLKP
jgi:hypothetical protein